MAEGATEERRDAGARPRPPVAGPGADPAPGRVLVVEDDADARRHLAAVLGRAWDVEAVPDGAAARASVRRDPPDLVLAAVAAGAGGLALVGELRADPRTAALPIVLLSPRADEEAIVAGLDAGADDVLVAPVAPAVLHARLRATIALARARSRDAGWRAALVRSLRDGVFVADADGVVVEVNDAWEDIVGYGQDGAPYAPPYPWWPDAGADPAGRAELDAARLHLATEGAGSYDVPYDRADGRRIWVSIAASQVKDPATGAVLYVGTARDVTAERRAEARRESVAALTSLLATASTDGEVLAALAPGVSDALGGEATIALWDRPEAPEPVVYGPDGPLDWAAVTPDARAALDAVRSGRAAAGRGGLGSALDGGRDAVAWVRLDGARTPTTSDRLLLSLITDLAGQALRRTHRYEVERNVARTLQRSMLGPRDTPATVHARYEPIDPDLAVGGDWYDHVDLGDGRTGLVVGDCVGQGLIAAAAMGQLRSAARALLLAGLGPGAVLDDLDRFAAGVPDAMCTTVFCAVADPLAGTLTYAAAAHPPALLLGADGRARWLDGGRSVPLASVAAGPRPEATSPLGPGDTLVAYTDGLVEHRDEPLPASLRRLADTAAAAAGLDPGELVDRLIAGLSPPEVRADDLAVLAYRVGPATGA